MLQYLFSHPYFLISGGIVGLFLGFLIQKGRLSQFSVIVGQLLLKDFTVFKVMLTAITIGAIGIYGILWFDLPIPLHIKKASLAALLVGGTLFGTGMAILGYCPGTCVAAAGQGSRDAWWGLLGMLAGTTAYAFFYPLIQKHILSKGQMIAKTLPETLGVSPWIFIGGLFVCLILTWRLVKR